jgi:hypothetical protein
MRIAKLLTGTVGALASAATATAALTATPAQADISCPNGFVPPSVNADCYFVSMMNKDGIGGDSQAGLISSAHALALAGVHAARRRES